MTDVRRWELLADAAAVDDRLPDGDARFVEEFDHLDAQTERDVYEALAELGRPGVATQEDITTARSLLLARRGTPRRRRWGIGIAVAAAAAILVIALGVPTAISWTRARDEGPAAGGLLTDMDAREAEVHDAERGRAVRDAVRRDSDPAPEAAPVEPEPDELQIFDEVDDAPEVDRVKPSRSAEPPATAGELLAKARSLVASGSDAKALATYERLRRAYPSSSEAHIANVSIGKIHLQRGKPSAALAAFDRYLAGGGGSLRQEALWGRVQALHRLGRVDARDEAAERLRKAYPGSVYLSQLPK